MIRLDGLSARARSVSRTTESRIENVTLEWERGTLAVLGTRADGTTALLEVLAGLAKARRGTALIHGESPAVARPWVAYVPLSCELPDSLRVSEVCKLGARLRGDPTDSPASGLVTLGIEHLANRPVSSLSVGERRAVAMAMAVTSRARVLLLEEPLSHLGPATKARVTDALRVRSAAGTAVVMTTASVRDATLLADQFGLLAQGTFSHLPAVSAHVERKLSTLRIVVYATGLTDLAPLVSALVQDPAVTTVSTETYAGTRVLHKAIAMAVTGPDLLPLARAVGLAAARSGANVETIECAVVPLQVIRPRLGLTEYEGLTTASATPVEPLALVSDASPRGPLANDPSRDSLGSG